MKKSMKREIGKKELRSNAEKSAIAKTGANKIAVVKRAVAQQARQIKSR